MWVWSPGERNGNPLQYSCLENPMNRGAWWAMVHRIKKSWTQSTLCTLLPSWNFSSFGFYDITLLWFSFEIKPPIPLFQSMWLGQRAFFTAEADIPSSVMVFLVPAHPNWFRDGHVTQYGPMRLDSSTFMDLSGRRNSILLVVKNVSDGCSKSYT